MAQQTDTAVLGRAGAVVDPWWIGWIEEIPGVECQERSREELLDCLRATLREALELDRREAMLREALELDPATPVKPAAPLGAGGRPQASNPAGAGVNAAFFMFSGTYAVGYSENPCRRPNPEARARIPSILCQCDNGRAEFTNS